MNVDPTQPDPTSRPGTGRLRRTIPQPIARQPESRTAQSVESRKDSVESPSRRGTSSRRSGRRTRTSWDSPERQREILQRIAQGFYRRPEVRDEVLRRLAANLEANPE